MPPLPLRTRVLIAGGLGVAGVAGLAQVVGSRLPASAAYPRNAVAVFAIMMTIAVAVVSERHPFPRFGPANHVTMVRAMLVALLASLVLERLTPGAVWWVIGATALMAAIDGLDGWLARRTRMASAFGARFDTEVDALLILILSILVWRYEKAGAWVIACGLMRYVFVVAGWILSWLAGPLQPTFRGKAVAVGQLAGLSLALAPIVPAPASAIVAAITLAALVWSFAIDVRRLWRGDGG